MILIRTLLILHNIEGENAPRHTNARTHKHTHSDTRTQTKRQTQIKTRKEEGRKGSNHRVS